MVDWEPVLDVTLDGRPMEGIPDLEPLEHSVLVRALNSGLMEGMLHLEPLEHSVLNAARDDRPKKEASVFELLEHSVLEMTLDNSSLEEMSDGEPLAHLVLNVTLDGRPMGGGDTGSGTVRSFGSGNGPGQWTHGGDITVRTVRYLVPNAALNSRPKEGASVLNSLKCSVIEMGLDRGMTTCYWVGWFRFWTRMLGKSPCRQRMGGFVPVMGTPMETLRRDFNIGTRREMFKISTRHLTACQCIMAVICVIRRIRFGTTSMPSPERRMLRTIILMFRRGWI